MDQVFLALVTHFVTKANINNRNAGLVVMGQDSQSEDCVFESQYAGYYFTLFSCKNSIDIWLKKSENKRKRGQRWPVFKIIPKQKMA